MVLLAYGVSFKDFKALTYKVIEKGVLINGCFIHEYMSVNNSLLKSSTVLHPMGT